MKKILFISSIPGVHIDRWYQYFKASKNIESKLIVCKHHMGESLFSKIFYLFTIKRIIIKAIKYYKPDIINLHTMFFPNYLFYKNLKCEIVITPWNGDIIHYYYGKDLIFIRRFKKIAKMFRERQIIKTMHSAALITYNSHSMKKRVKEMLYKKIPYEYVQVPGVDTNKWVKSANKTIQRKELNLPKNKYLVLSTRQLGPSYNIDIIVEAAYKLSKINSNIIFLFVFHEDKKKRKKLTNIIEQYSLKDKVIIIGQVKYYEMLKYYQACDIHISISSKDSCPQSVLEGMSTQIPTIVGNIPELRELIKNNHSGLLVPCRDADLLVACVIKLLTDKELKDKLAFNGRKVVMKKYDYVTNMEKMERLFLEM